MIPRCPTRWSADGERRLEDRCSRASAGARPSSGAITSSSQRSSTPASRSRRSRVSISATGRRRRRRTAGWCTTSTSRPARFAGSGKSSSTPPGKAKHLKNSYASETPVTDGERVYFYFGNAGLFAFDMNGKPRVVEADRPVQDAQQLGNRRFARSSTATASTSSTTTTSSRSSRPTTSGPARRSGA